MDALEIMLSEISQAQKDKQLKPSFLHGFRTVRRKEIESRMTVTEAEG
jgi:hypothetical protein